MNPKFVLFVVPIVLLVVFLSIFYRQSKGESFGPYEPVCPSIQARGNCLPGTLEYVAINVEANISQEYIADVSFLSEEEIVAVDLDGEVYLYEIPSGQAERIYSVGSSYVYSPTLFVINSEEFLIKACVNRNGYNSIWSQFYCLNRDGEPLWIRPADAFDAYYPVYDGEKYVLIIDNGLFELTRYGSLDLLTDVPSGSWNPIYEPSSLGGIIMGIVGAGPYLATKDSGYRDNGLLVDGWNTGLSDFTVDTNGRVIGFWYDQLNPDDATQSVVILDHNAEEQIIIRIEDIPGIEQPETTNEISFNRNLASNGESVSFVFDTCICKLEDDEFKVWHDLADEITALNATGLDTKVLHRIKTYVIDETNNHFIVLYESQLFFGNEDITAISFNSIVVTRLVFSESYERACVGTENGDLIVFDLVYKWEEVEN